MQAYFRSEYTLKKGHSHIYARWCHKPCFAPTNNVIIEVTVHDSFNPSLAEPGYTLPLLTA